MAFAAIILILVGLALIYAGKHYAHKPLSGVGFVGSTVGLGLLISQSIATIPAGHVGVKTLFGAVQKTTLPEGLSFVNPFVSVWQMSGRTQTYTMSGKTAINALSFDGLKMPLDVSVVYRLDPSNASWVLQNVGFDYQNVLLRPAIRTAVRGEAGKINSQEIYSTKRQELVDRIESAIQVELEKIFSARGFNNKAVHIETVLLRNVELPVKVKNAIEAKLEEEQRAQQMVFRLERERLEAERKKIEATGIQEFQTIVQQGINEQLLKWKGIEATQNLAKSPNTKIIIIGGKDGLPIILNSQQ